MSPYIMEARGSVPLKGTGVRACIGSLNGRIDGNQGRKKGGTVHKASPVYVAGTLRVCTRVNRQSLPLRPIWSTGRATGRHDRDAIVDVRD